MFSTDLLQLSMLTLDDARAKSLRIATAESCTGGLIAGLFTEIAGSSDVFERGFVTYSNRAKEEVLGVPRDLIADQGAVSEPVARMMADGALAASNAHVAVAVTGVAGPGGGTALKPVGLVHIACARENYSMLHERFEFGPLGRTEVRIATIRAALEMVQSMIAR